MQRNALSARQLHNLYKGLRGVLRARLVALIHSQPGPGYGHPGSAYRLSIILAESLCRALDWFYQEVEPPEKGKVVSVPKVGGLHHLYTRSPDRSVKREAG